MCREPGLLRVLEPVPKYLSLCSPALPLTATVRYAPLAPSPCQVPEYLLVGGNSRTGKAHGGVMMDMFTMMPS